METENQQPNEKIQMETMVSILNSLDTLGFKTQFKANLEGLLSLTSNKVFQPEQVKIVHFYRFEGESNPSDSSILYAIETQDGEKGTLVDGYGNDSDLNVSVFIQSVKEIHK